MRTRLALLAALPLFCFSGLAAAQTPFYPYYSKNNVHYDRFDWHIYTTDHFEIYYYPELEHHLERVTSYAESAYQKVSSDLKHDLSFKVPLILFKTHSEFEQENVEPGAGQEGVGAFAEPFRDRMLLPIDDPPDRLYGLITHELTHIFEFDIIPQSLIRRSVPLWVNEGLSEYERADWTPFDLMQVRDAAVADIVPRMTKEEGYGSGGARFLAYNLGHAVFEFIEAKFGQEGIRQFLFSLRKSVIGGGEDAYMEAFKMTAEEFDQAFDRYLKERFKPFRDKERPADYGRDLSPNPEHSHFSQAWTIAPSPSGDLLATITVNRKDGELDIVLISAKDGSVVRNLTEGFDKDLGFTNITQMSVDGFAMPWMSWSPKGDRLAYFVRTEKERTLIVQNVLTRKIEIRVPMKSVDEPESPAFSPDGSSVAFSGMRGATRDIFTVNLETQEIINQTTDDFWDYAPTYSPNGRYLIFNARVSGNQKLFRLDLDGSKRKTQVTFGTHDEAGAQFIDDNTLVFASTATDPAVPLEPEVARNGNVFNVWTLDMNTGELRQFSDALGGNTSPVVLREGNSHKIAFVSYYKGEHSVRLLDRTEPIHSVASSDFGSPGPIIDFQPPLQHSLVSTNQRRKGAFEKMFLEGRPPVNLGVTNNGDVFGGTQISFGDVLGDKQINIFAASISQYRTLSVSYVNLGRRLQYALNGFSSTQFFYGALENVFYSPELAPLIGRDQAIATRTVRGGTALGLYPFSRYKRVEVSAGVVNLNESYNDPLLQQYSEDYQQQQGVPVFRSGTMIPLSVAFVSETTVFREFGPLAGSTMRLAYDVSPRVFGTLSRQNLDGDVRYYQRLASTGVLALRARGFKSVGDSPDYIYFGGNSEMRGYDYLQFLGQNVFFGNAELRFPIIEAALTPIGVVGGVRGVFFANMGAGWFNNTGFKFWTSDPEIVTVTTGYNQTPAGFVPIEEPRLIQGFRLRDARASYGFGLETFALGFPIHFDWAWRTLFNREWEDALYFGQGGTHEFRKARFAVWIGYDF
jgi:WD40-like Beta Propeller Repeat